ncbi:hypothetical protein E6R60_27310 [Streptomyces sp. A0642]|nr:hypothetical protein E6R60_27310 [Streptomyces sp. A0642]
MACSVIGILFSKLRVYASVLRWFDWCRCNKKPLVPGGKRGERVGAVCGVPSRNSASADALSKYENSGAHGIDPLSDALDVSSGWDGRLSM